MDRHIEIIVFITLAKMNGNTKEFGIYFCILFFIGKIANYKVQINHTVVALVINCKTYSKTLIAYWKNFFYSMNHLQPCHREQNIMSC